MSEAPTPRCDFRYLTKPLYQVMAVLFRGHRLFFEVVIDDVVVYASNNREDALQAMHEAIDMVTLAKRSREIL